MKSSHHIKSRGFGDTVAKAVEKVSGGMLKKCGGCNSRQNWLNKVFPYKQIKGHRAQVNYVKSKYPIVGIELHALEEQIYQLRRHNAQLKGLYKTLMMDGNFAEQEEGIRFKVANAAGAPVYRKKKKEDKNSETVPTIPPN